MKSPRDQLDETSMRDTAAFLDLARSQDRLHKETLSVLEAAYSPRESYRIAPLKKFHPPRTKR